MKKNIFHFGLLDWPKAVVICFSFIFVSNTGRAAENYYEYNIEAKPLAETLIEFSKQTGFQFFFENEALEGIKGPRLVGKFSTQEGLETLLEGTGIVFSIRGGTVIVFEKEQQAQSSLQRIEEVTIIGTRAKGLGFGGIVPVTIMDSEEFYMKSISDGTQIFSQFPQANAVISKTNSNLRALGAGAVLVDLRNLGPKRTLVLVNGRRFAPTGSIPPLYSGIDISTIPMDFVDRIEILTGSASTLYGSDAVAGVINFNLKTNMEGLEGNFLTGISEKGDGEIFKASLSAGGSLLDGRAHLSGHVTFSREGKILQSDRPDLSQPGRFVNGIFEPGAGGSSLVPSGVIWGYESGPGTSFPFLINSGQPSLLISDDGTTFNDFTAAPGQLFNFTEFQFLSLPKTRFLINLNGAYEFGGGKETFFSFFAGSSTAKTQLAPPPFTADLEQAIRIPFDNPFIPQSLQPLADQLQADGATGFLMEKRILEAGVRNGHRKQDYQHILWGISGPTGPFENLEFTYQFSTVNSIDQENLVIDLERVQIAADPTLCAATTGCTPINFFGINTISQPQIEFIKTAGPTIQKGRSSQHLISATFSGALAETQAGNINAKLGLEFRREKFSVTLDEIVSNANKVGSTGLAPTQGSFNVFESFFDLVIPIIKDRKKIRSLSWELAFRASQYSNIGSIFSWKTGFEYVPTSGLRFRTMFQKGVRAPNIQEFFTPTNPSAFGIRDPCSDLAGETNQTVVTNCLSANPLGNVPFGFIDGRGGIGGTVSGNTALRSEKSDSFTLGFAYVPNARQFLGNQNFYFSFDLYWINTKSPIFLPVLTDFLNRCYESVDFSSDFCGTNPTNDLPFFQRNSDSFQISNVNLAVLNGGSETVAGLDIEIRHTPFGTRFGEEKFGLASSAAKLDLMLRYTLNFFQEFVDVPETRGLVTTGQISRPYHRIFFQANLSRKSSQISWTTQFQSTGLLTFSEPTRNFGNIAPATFYHDLAFRKKLGANLSFALGVENLFDQTPPVLSSSVAGTDTLPNLFDVTGRRYWLRFGVTY